MDRLVDAVLDDRPGPRSRTRLLTIDGTVRERTDWVATEEPLEIRLRAGSEVRPVAVTMRTPGNDVELAAGFLHAEGIIDTREDLRSVRYCVEAGTQQYNVVTVDLAAPRLPELGRLDRYGTVSSACGVCGKATLDGLADDGLAAVAGDLRVSSAVLSQLPDRLRDAQREFSRTGGLHAAGAFDADGAALVVREDVGRHNAMDKLAGWALLDGRLPLDQHVVVVSGRASYELAQKAVRAGTPVLCAVSAPSSLAIDVARRFGLTLVGFLRGERCNVYTHPHRIIPPGG